MHAETLADCDRLLIRRLVLGPGEAMGWHTDRCHRFTVVVTGSRLRLEFRDDGEIADVEVQPGLAGWDTPTERIHRAVNVGPGAYEEVVTFYRSARDVDPQPPAPV